MFHGLKNQIADTIKVRMQLSPRDRNPPTTDRGLFQTTMSLAHDERAAALYRGLGVALTGVVPKMAIQFTGFETCKQMLADKRAGLVNGPSTFVGASTSL